MLFLSVIVFVFYVFIIHIFDSYFEFELIIKCLLSLAMAMSK